MTSQPDPAATRFAMLQLARLSGALLVLLAVLVIAGKTPAWLGTIPKEAGYGLAALGLFEFYALPRFLARRWRSPRG
ncbi:hypothetical protein [Novosphingobium sp.]|jgi:hypothetical protein|uniref:hypothetical protein n=1 Tax=Novosphingobium sp. TaxID=1874826 RepID=UPI00356A80F1|nr:hypothetical protein [Novosphingobium sp.]